ncbi:MAG: hypothetical protein ABII93_05730 [Chrysiogenia bacterium]
MTKFFEQEKQQGEQGPRLADIRKEVLAKMKEHEDADAEATKKAAERKKRVGELEAKLTGERALLERMKKDCLTLMFSSREQKQAKVAADSEQLRAEVQAGKIGVMEYHEKVTAQRKREQGELTKVDREIELAISAVREKQHTVLQLEKEYWENFADFYYLSAYPSEAGLGELKKVIQEMSSRSQSLAYHYRNANAELEKIKDKLNRSKGMALTAGWSMDEMNIEQVRALPLFPEIPDDYLPSLFSLIQELEAYEAKRREAGQAEGIYYVRLSYMSGKSQPWDYLCRNSGSPIIQMSNTIEAVSSPGIVSMSGLPIK